MRVWETHGGSTTLPRLECPEEGVGVGLSDAGTRLIYLSVSSGPSHLSVRELTPEAARWLAVELERCATELERRQAAELGWTRAPRCGEV